MIRLPAIFVFVLMFLSLFSFSLNVEAPPSWLERVDLRTQNTRTFQNPLDLSGFDVDMSIRPIHYDNPAWKVIDNSIIPSAQFVPELGLARWEMIQDDYEWFSLQDFNTIPMFLFRNRSVPDSYITFSPQLLQWTNDLEQISLVNVANIGVTGIVEGSTIRFPNGYGTGIDFDITLGPGRMGKILRLNNPLTTPPKFILDGGNASLELVQFFSIPSGPNQQDIFVDGIQWDLRNREDTFNFVEFRVSGNSVFSFSAGNAMNDTGNIHIKYVLAKSGNNLKVSISTPYSWLKDTSYPVLIDPSLDLQVSGTDNDAWEAANGNTDTTSGQPNNDDPDEWLGWRWTSVTVPNAATIDSAVMNIYFPNSGGDEPLEPMFGEDEDNAVAFTAGAGNNDISGRTQTTATITFDNTNLGAPGWFNPPSVASIVAEITSRGSWSSGNALVIFGHGTSSARDMLVSTYDDVTSRASWLNITYTVSGWTNTAPVIFQTLVSNETGHNISYTEFFNATDIDTNQTLWWSLASNLSSLGIAFDNRSSWVNGTPTFAERDSSYYVNVTAADQGCSGACNLTDFHNYTLYVNNTVPSITDKITSDEGGHNISYSEDFTPSDANSDAGIWTLVTNATFLSIDSAGTVTGTPLFADRDSDYYVNATFRDYTGGQSGFDWTNYTLWINNTVISISNPITDDTGVNNTAYSFNFNHVDSNSDTPEWNVTTNAPFTLTISASGVVSGTPDTVGTFWVNVTVRDYLGGQGGLDFVNYTLEITEEVVVVPVDFSTAVIFIAGIIPFLFALVLGFWQKQAALVIVGSVYGVLFGLWVIFSIYWVAGMGFVGMSILFSYIGWVNIERMQGI